MLQNLAKGSNSSNPTNKNANPYFLQAACHYNNEFYGYLYVDENVETLSTQSQINIYNLTPEERITIECGHRSLLRFIELCLSDISDKSTLIGEVLNPYSMYKPINLSSGSKTIVSDEELAPAVLCFKSGKLYNALINSNFTDFFNKLTPNHVKRIILSLDATIRQGLGGDIASDIEKFAFSINSKKHNPQDVILEYSIVIYALRTSLVLACRDLYRSMCGVKLFVLNNDNIINIEKYTESQLCNTFKVFSQDIAIQYRGDEMHSLLLIDCDSPQGDHIHDFGMIISLSYNLVGEFGSSAKYSFVVVNEEMIYIYNLTDAILNKGLTDIKILN